MERKHLKFGGVSFKNNVSPEEINEFVRNLPESERDSLFEVVNKLRDAGLITLYDGDNITIDEIRNSFKCLTMEMVSSECLAGCPAGFFSVAYKFRSNT